MLRIFLSLLFAITLRGAVAAPTDTTHAARSPFRWGVLAGTNRQNFTALGFGPLPGYRPYQRSSFGLNVGVVGLWPSKNTVTGLRLEVTATLSSHRWLDDAPGTDLRYRSHFIGVAPLLDLALTRSRRLHLVLGPQLDIWLPSSRVTGTQSTGRLFYYDGQLTAFNELVDRKFHPRRTFRTVLGVAWAVRPRLEIGLRGELGERYAPDVSQPRGIGYPPYAVYGMASTLAMQAVRLSAVWWLR